MPLSHSFDIEYNNKPIVLDLNYLKSTKGFIKVVNTYPTTTSTPTSSNILNISKLGSTYKCVLGITDDNTYGTGTDNYTIVALNAIVLTLKNGRFSINTEELIGKA